MAGVAPELAVREGSFLERAERLHPLVRLPEESQPEHAEDDDEQGRADERDEQLGVDPGGQPSDRSDERVVGRAQQPAFRGAGCCVLLRHVCLRQRAQIFSSAVLPTKFVISQRPSILATSTLPAVTAATFPVSTSTKWHSKWSVPRSPSIVTFSLYAGWSDSQCVSGLNGNRVQPDLPDLLLPRHRLPGPERARRVRREQAHHLVDVLLRDRLVEGPLDLADRVQVGPAVAAPRSEAELELEPPQAESATTSAASAPPIRVSALSSASFRRVVSAPPHVTMFTCSMRMSSVWQPTMEDERAAPTVPAGACRGVLAHRRRVGQVDCLRCGRRQ